jgi:hypothetical protein
LRRQRRSSRGAYVKLASACSESSAFKCPVARLARTQTQAQILALSYASSPPGANNGRGTRGELKGCRANRLGLVRTALAARAAKTLSVGQLRLCAERLVETLWAPHLRCARSPCARPHLRPSAGALLLRAPTRTSPRPRGSCTFARARRSTPLKIAKSTAHAFWPARPRERVCFLSGVPQHLLHVA